LQSSIILMVLLSMDIHGYIYGNRDWVIQNDQTKKTVHISSLSWHLLKHDCWFNVSPYEMNPKQLVDVLKINDVPHMEMKIDRQVLPTAADPVSTDQVIQSMIDVISDPEVKSGFTTMWQTEFQKRSDIMEHKETPISTSMTRTTTLDDKIHIQIRTCDRIGCKISTKLSRCSSCKSEYHIVRTSVNTSTGRQDTSRFARNLLLAENFVDSTVLTCFDSLRFISFHNLPTLAQHAEKKCH
jgi:hypothetical protein